MKRLIIFIAYLNSFSHLVLSDEGEVNYNCQFAEILPITDIQSSPACLLKQSCLEKIQCSGIQNENFATNYQNQLKSSYAYTLINSFKEDLKNVSMLFKYIDNQKQASGGQIDSVYNKFKKCNVSKMQSELNRCSSKYGKERLDRNIQSLFNPGLERKFSGLDDFLSTEISVMEEIVNSGLGGKRSIFNRDYCESGDEFASAKLFADQKENLEGEDDLTKEDYIELMDGYHFFNRGAQFMSDISEPFDFDKSFEKNFDSIVTGLSESCASTQDKLIELICPANGDFEKSLEINSQSYLKINIENNDIHSGAVDSDLSLNQCVIKECRHENELGDYCGIKGDAKRIESKEIERLSMSFPNGIEMGSGYSSILNSHNKQSIAERELARDVCIAMHCKVENIEQMRAAGSSATCEPKRESLDLERALAMVCPPDSTNNLCVNYRDYFAELIRITQDQSVSVFELAEDGELEDNNGVKFNKRSVAWKGSLSSAYQAALFSADEEEAQVQLAEVEAIAEIKSEGNTLANDSEVMADVTRYVQETQPTRFKDSQLSTGVKALSGRQSALEKGLAQLRSKIGIGDAQQAMDQRLSDIIGQYSEKMAYNSGRIEQMSQSLSNRPSSSASASTAGIDTSSIVSFPDGSNSLSDFYNSSRPPEPYVAQSKNYGVPSTSAQSSSKRSDGSYPIQSASTIKGPIDMSKTDGTGAVEYLGDENIPTRERAAAGTQRLGGQPGEGQTSSAGAGKTTPTSVGGSGAGGISASAGGVGTSGTGAGEFAGDSTGRAKSDEVDPKEIVEELVEAYPEIESGKDGERYPVEVRYKGLDKPKRITLFKEAGRVMLDMDKIPPEDKVFEGVWADQNLRKAFLNFVNSALSKAGDR